MVSIIIPVYNREKYIADALESAASQSWRDLEIIVIDDGSTDGSRQVIESFLGDPRIIYRHQPNSGRPSIARNAGLKIARGQYVCFLDSDDVLSSDSIERRVAVLDANPDISFVCADWLDFTGEFSLDKLIPSYAPEVLGCLPEQLICRTVNDGIIYKSDFIFHLFHNHLICAGTVMLRRHLLDTVGFFDTGMTIGEDRDLWFRLAAFAPFCYLMVPLCYIRTHSGNITNNRMHNLAADVMVLCRFLASTRRQQEKWRPLYPKLSDYFSDAGWHLLDADLYRPAKQALRQALRYRFSLKNLWYGTVSLLPEGTIRPLRRMKRALTQRSTNTCMR